MLCPYKIFVLMAIEILTFAKINLVGAKHYRHHYRLSLQSSNGNASPKLHNAETIYQKNGFKTPSF